MNYAIVKYTRDIEESVFINYYAFNIMVYHCLN